MKTFNFKVIEYWIGGIKPERIIEIKAKTEKSAWKKLYEIQGNRDWSVSL